MLTMFKNIISKMNTFENAAKNKRLCVDGKIITYMIHSRNFMIMLVSAILLFACERHSQIWKQMDTAEVSIIG